MQGVRLTRNGARRWKQGHPWIFRADVITDAAPPAGELVRVQGPDGRTLGRAAWSDRSAIALRALPLDADEDPEAGWLRLLDAAIDRRAKARPSARLVNADADGLPGLIVDRYGEGLSLQTLSQAADRRRDAVVARLIERLAPRVIALRNDARSRDYEGLPQEKHLLRGDSALVDAPLGALRWRFDLLEGQKTGGFLDQVDNQLAVAALATGECLDGCTYEGGFALHLAAAGRPVLAIDSSAPAIERLRGHAARNGLTAEAEVQNLFERLRALENEGRRFDAIVLDPPPFARSRKALEAARRAYKEINLRGFKLLRPGGRLFTFSCSAQMTRADFEALIGEAAADAGRFVRVIERRGPPADHPSLLTAPETDYLKALFLEVDR